MGTTVVNAVGIRRLDQYPAPPTGLAVEHEIAAMFDRWSRYKAGQALLGDTPTSAVGHWSRVVGGRRLPTATGWTAR